MARSIRRGRLVAFVRDGNLYVVDVATQTERALTTDGGGLIRNGAGRLGLLRGGAQSPVEAVLVEPGFLGRSPFCGRTMRPCPSLPS